VGLFLSNHALGEENVRLAGTVRVRHHADNCEADADEELVRMCSQVPNGPNRAWNVGIQINSAQGRLVVLIVTPRPQGNSALLTDDRFEVANQCAPDALSSVRWR